MMKNAPIFRPQPSAIFEGEGEKETGRNVTQLFRATLRASQLRTIGF